MNDPTETPDPIRIYHEKPILPVMVGSGSEAPKRPGYFTVRELAVIAILSALGGVVSVPVGYAGNFLNALTIFPFGAPQIFAGIHVLWIVLAGLQVKRLGAATVTGVLKGLVELTLYSFHGALILPISITEGVVAEVMLALLGRNRRLSVGIAGGLSTMSNVAVISIMVLKVPLPIILFMGALAFVSGFFFSAYVGKTASDRIRLIKTS